MAEVLVEIHCRGCLRYRGVARNDFPMYCDTNCSDDYPALVTEERDSLMEALYLTRQYAIREITDMADLSRQRGQQIISLRDIKRQRITNQ